MISLRTNCPQSTKTFLPTRATYRARLLIGLAVGLLGLAAASPAGAITLFYESFEGYNSFPTYDPPGDPINPGLPRQSEGADEYWYGGRFEPGDNGSIDSDLAVQKYGGGSNGSHTGRFEDDAGLLFNISTENLETAVLKYKWRTFSVGHGDRFKAGYFVGDIDFGGSRYKNFVAEYGSDWWDDQWTQITVGKSNAWKSVTTPLPVGEPSIWVAFWLDGGKGDYGKIDKIRVKGTLVVPEPSSIFIAVIGAAMCGCMAVRRRVSNRRGGTAR